MARKYSEHLNETIFRGEDGKLYKKQSVSRSTLRNSVEERDVNNRMSWGVLKVLALVLILAMFISFITSSNPPTFQGFLEMLSNVPTIDTQGIFEFFQPDFGDWGIFDWLKDFIEWNINLLAIPSWLFAVMYNAIAIGIYFITWLF